MLRANSKQTGAATAPMALGYGAAVILAATSGHALARPGGYEWYLIDYPPVGHSIWNDPRVHAIAVVLKDAVDISKPPGYPDYGTNTPANLAKRTADHLEYQGYFRGGPLDNGHGYGGVTSLINWGWGNDYHLETNAGDAVAGGCGVYSIFNAVGMGQGPGTLAQATSDYLTALKTECDQRGLTYPEIFMWDFENRSGAEFAFKNADVIPYDPIGFWDRCVADPRYTTEVLVSLGGDKTLADLVAAQPPRTRTSTNWWHQGLDNRAWCKDVYNPIEERVHDEAMYRTLGQFVNSLFPGAVWGDYALEIALDSHYPYRDQFNSWLYWYQQDPAMRLHASIQGPICYGPRMIGGASYEPAYTEVPELGSTQQEIWRNFGLGQLKCVMAGPNIVPALPAVETPNTVSANIIDQYTPTIEDVGWLFARQAALGQKRWLVFNPHTTAQQATDIQAAIAVFDASVCYANCDASTTVPCLNVLDFGCFLNKCAAGCSAC